MCKACEELTKTTDNRFEDDVLDGYFLELYKLIYEYQQEIMREVIEQYDDIPLQKISIDLTSTFYTSLSDIFGKIFIYGQKQTLKNVSDEMKELEAVAGVDFDVAFDIAPDFAIDYAESTSESLIKNIDTTTYGEIQKIVQESLRQGRSQDKLASEIQSQFEQFNHYRATLIARQETANAMGGGKFQQFTESAKEFGVVGRKRTQTHQDDKVRPSHLANEEAGWIPANEPFPGTGTMHAPHGFNCRCADSQRMFLPDEL